MNIPSWLQDAGAHERPWWLKTHVEADRAPPGYCKYELPQFEPKLNEKGEPLKSQSSTKGRHKSSSQGHGAVAPSSPTAPKEVQRAPATPNTHVRNLQHFVSRPMKVTHNDEFHRMFWYPHNTLSCPLGEVVNDATRRGPEAKDGLGKRKKVEGSLDSDYLHAGRQVESGWEGDKLRRAKSEPGVRGEFGHRPNAINPSLLSREVTGSMVGGTNLSLKHSMPKTMQREEKRQIGLYEDSYQNWRKEYKIPAHGLAQSDVTQFGGEIQKQKALMGKPKAVPILRHPKLGTPCPPWAP